METDRQIEIANQEIEKHFCIFVNYPQDDLSEKLPIAEFATNNNKWIFKKLSSFFALKSLYLYMSFNIVDLSENTMLK